MSVSALRTELHRKSAVCWPLSIHLSASVDLTMYRHAILVTSYRSRKCQLSLQSPPCPCAHPLSCFVKTSLRRRDCY